MGENRTIVVSESAETPINSASSGGANGESHASNNPYQLPAAAHVFKRIVWYQEPRHGESDWLNRFTDFDRYCDLSLYNFRHDSIKQRAGSPINVAAHHCIPNHLLAHRSFVFFLCSLPDCSTNGYWLVYFQVGNLAQVANSFFIVTRFCKSLHKEQALFVILTPEKAVFTSNY